MKLPTVNKSGVILVAAIACGGLAAFAGSRYIAQTLETEKARLNPNVEQVDVVVAKTDLERGAIVGSENMAVRRVPSAYVPGTAVLPDAFGNVEGARLAVDMRGGEILLHRTLEGADASTFATTVREGVRALTISVDDVNSVAGLMQPGDHIDLFYTATPPSRAGIPGLPGQEQTFPLMQNVRVLATGRQVRPAAADSAAPGAGRAFSTVTVEATPLDAQRLILAQTTGTITAVLRGPNDTESLDARPIDARTLFNAPVTTPVRTARVAPPRAEIIVGGRGGASREFVPVLPAQLATVPASAVPGDARTLAALESGTQAAARTQDTLDQLLRLTQPAPMQVTREVLSQ